MSHAAVHHPLFARFYSRFAKREDARGNAENRQELLAGLSGRVIEVGAGVGSNFAHYPATVTEVVAVEPACSCDAIRSPLAMSFVHTLELSP